MITHVHCFLLVVEKSWWMQGVYQSLVTRSCIDSLQDPPRIWRICSPYEIVSRVDCYWTAWLWPYRLRYEVHAVHDRGGRGLHQLHMSSHYLKVMMWCFQHFGNTGKESCTGTCTCTAHCANCKRPGHSLAAARPGQEWLQETVTFWGQSYKLGSLQTCSLSINEQGFSV